MVRLFIVGIFISGCDSQSNNDDDGTPSQILSADIFYGIM